MPKQVDTIEEFRELVAGEEPVVIDFTATWCPPCRFIGPEFARIAEENADSDVKFIKVDVDVNGEASKEAGITCMPTFQVWANGEKLEEFSGASKDKLEALVAKYVKDGAAAAASA